MKTTKQKVPALRFPEFEGEWEEKKLGEVSEIITGSTPKTSNILYYGGDKLFVSPADINEVKKIVSTKTTLTDLGFAQGRKVSKDSVLFVCIGSTIGKTAMAGTDCITNQQINSVEANEKYHNNYIYYILEKHASRIKLLAGTQAVPIINKSDFSKLKFPFPSLPEQQKIADFLSATDKRLELLKEKKQGLEDYKRGAMQRIFSQELRFTRADGSAYEDWEEKKLGEVCEKKSSNLSQSELELNNGIYKVYGASGFLKYIDFYLIEKPYIGIVKDGAGVGRMFLCEKESSVLGTLDIIINRENSDIEFLYYFMNQINFEKYSIGSTIPHIYFKDYSKEKLKFPSLEEQTQIANFLSAIDVKIEKLNEQIEATENYKKGLLQQMFV